MLAYGTRPPSVGGTLLTFALWRETIHLPAALTSHVSIALTGMGPERAEAGIKLAIERFKPTRVVTAGVAGALCPSACVGDVLFDDELDLGLERYHARSGRFYFHHLLAAKKAELRAITKAHAVEMESDVIRRECLRRGIPSATVRAVSDPWDWDWPPLFAEMINARGGIRYGKVAREVLLDPSLIPVMRRLKRDMDHATKNLGVVLGQLSQP